MAFASPTPTSRTILSIRDTSTATATVNYPFTIPQDADMIVGKIWLASTWNASGTVNVTTQTSEDGGTTWRDVATTAIGGNTPAASINSATGAHFFAVAAACAGTPRGASNYIGSVASGSLIAAALATSVTGTTSGLPMLGTFGRVTIAFAASVATGGVNVDIFAPTTQLR